MQEVMAEVEAAGLSGEEALMAAFEQNKPGPVARQRQLRVHGRDAKVANKQVNRISSFAVSAVQ